MRLDILVNCGGKGIIRLESIQVNYVGRKYLLQLLNWSVGSRAYVPDDLHLVLDVVEVEVIVAGLDSLPDLIWTFQHVVLNDEVDARLVGQINHVNQAITVHVCELEQVLVLDL